MRALVAQVPSFVFHLGAVAGTAFLAWFAWRHLGYYRLPLPERPYHADHPALRSSGQLGLLCGIAATALFLLNLSYLVRKRFVGLRWLGSLRSWMAFHVFTGILGAALVLPHSAFLPRSALGLYATACLAVVVLSGLIGRYIYAKVPRSVEGSELQSGELRREMRLHMEELQAAGLPPGLLEWENPEELPEAKGLLRRFLGLLAGDRELRRSYRRLKKAVRARPELRPLAGRILPLARAYLRERQWLARYGELRGLMGTWRFLHRWLAIVMLAVVVFHVVVAVRFGDLRWPEVPVR